MRFAKAKRTIRRFVQSVPRISGVWPRRNARCFENVRFAEAKRPKKCDQIRFQDFRAFGLDETHVLLKTCVSPRQNAYFGNIVSVWGVWPRRNARFQKNVRFVEAKRPEIMDPHLVTLCLAFLISLV